MNDMMVLKSLFFQRSFDSENSWRIEGRSDNEENSQPVSFASINLIVGKNASGKSRTLGAIRVLSDLFSGDKKLENLGRLGLKSAIYRTEFIVKNQIVNYELTFEQSMVTHEKLVIGNDVKLDRSAGKLFFEKEDKNIEFEIASDILAISRRDQKQHPFFELLYSWGKHLRHYKFGGDLGRDSLTTRLLDVDDIKVDSKDGDEVIKLLPLGFHEYGEHFKNGVIDDMKTIGYDLTDLINDKIESIPIQAYGILVNESDVSMAVDQTEMSQGMFRALSLLIQINYSLLEKKSAIILIDDIGEGLDFNRSTKLIKLLVQKIENSNIQIFMTSNDRFVMNSIPLEHWSLIERKPGRAVFYDVRNSEKTFKQYKYTGFNNFDFLASEFYINGFDR